MNNQKNINFVLVGAKATGKTVYLASLYLNTKIITSQNAKTTKYLKQMSDTLLEGKFPNATSGTLYDLIFNYKDENFNCTLQIDDVDGHFIETLSEEDEHTQNERHRLIQKLKSAEGILFFFPFETKFHENSIKEFNYQIDTVISQLKSIYDDRDNIPVPASILVSKWDMSSDYKTENEEEKATEYIQSNQFLKLAKEKIEENFLYSKVIPFSAIGKELNHLEPYNLEKPLQYSLQNVYSIWSQKIEELKENDKEVLLFLSKIYKDIQFYKNGKYLELYKEKEKVVAQKIIEKLNSIHNHREYRVFQKENKDVINILYEANKTEIKKLENKFKKQRIIKISIIIATLASILAFIANTYAQSDKINNENKLFSKITMLYKNHNYDQCLKAINQYNTSYKSLNFEHKKNVINIEKNIQKKVAINHANKIVNEITFDNLNEIEKLLTHFSKLGIDKEDISQRLITKKNELLLSSSFNTFKDNLKKKSLDEALIDVRENWKEFYSQEHQKISKNILNKKMNMTIKTLLEAIPNISSIQEYKKLDTTLKHISSLVPESKIDKIKYIPSLNESNEYLISRKKSLLKKYTYILKHGLSHVKISFGAYYPENKPLGFNCLDEKEIILFIKKYKFDYEKKTTCSNITITWKQSAHVFKANIHYPIEVTEVDLIDNNHYNEGSLKLTEDELINIYNKKYLKKDIGSGYFIGFKRN